MTKLRKISRLLVLITSPLLLFSLLIYILTLRPMGTAFKESFFVQNNSDQVVFFTPIGTFGDNNRAVLRQLNRIPGFYLPALKFKHFKLNPGQRKGISYDWDDINFSHIYIKTQEGIEKQLVVDPNPVHYSKEGGYYLYYPPSSKYYVIDNLNSLPKAELAVAEAARKEIKSRAKLIIVLLYILPLFPFIWTPAFVYLFILRRKGKKAIQEASS